MNPHVLEFVKLCLFNGTARVRRWEYLTGTAIADTCRAVIPDYNKLLEHSLRQAVISRELGRAFGPGAEEAFQLLSANGYEEPARERRISRQALYERVQRLKRVLSHSAALKALWEDL